MKTKSASGRTLLVKPKGAMSSSISDISSAFVSKRIPSFLPCIRNGSLREESCFRVIVLPTKIGRLPSSKTWDQARLRWRPRKRPTSMVLFLAMRLRLLTRFRHTSKPNCPALLVGFVFPLRHDPNHGTASRNPWCHYSAHFTAILTAAPCGKFIVTIMSKVLDLNLWVKSGSLVTSILS